MSLTQPTEGKFTYCVRKTRRYVEPLFPDIFLKQFLCPPPKKYPPKLGVEHIGTIKANAFILFIGFFLQNSRFKRLCVRNK